MVLGGVLVLGLLSTATALVQPRRLGQCSFENEPKIPYFWDPTCPRDGNSLGCMADGVNSECRFCGAGDYADVFCPASWCEFADPPHLPYYWDHRCTMGDLGCLADGVHVACRFCGEYPYNGTVHCPESAGAITPADSCDFDNDPITPFFWDASCEEGMLGCKADGKHQGCRFCGAGDYATVNCPASLCTFDPDHAPVPPYRYYWEPQCWASSEHILGCKADGVHPECRFCGGAEYSSIPCPAWSS